MTPLERNKQISAAQVKALFGITEMTLWRWQKRDDLSFPKPKYISNRKYFNEAAVLAWMNNRGEMPDKEFPPHLTS